MAGTEKAKEAAAKGFFVNQASKLIGIIRMAMLEITGYAAAIFLAEMLVKIWIHQ